MKHTYSKTCRRLFSKGFLSGLISCLFLLTASIAFGQTKDITGTVTSQADGSTLPGVNVTIKGSTQGAITDLNGTYSLKASSGDTLRFSFISYKAEERVVGNETTINVVMATDQRAIDEVVVVGYGTQKKSDLTGSVAVIDAKEMQKISTNDLTQQLQGRTPGITVTSDGQPGSIPTVRLRGVGTFGNSQPLYVIDGVPIQGTPRDFNPNDIESMQVLKDASAAAIYGARGANGVIIITTKTGNLNQPLQLGYNMYYGIDQVNQRIPVAGTDEYRMLNAEMRANSSDPSLPALAPGNDPESEFYIENVDTDWQDALLKNGMRQNHNLQLSGGGETSTYFMSLDYFENEGTIVGNGPDYERYSARINTTTEKGRLSVGTNIYYNYSKENSLTFRDDILLGGIPPLINSALLAIPTQRVYDSTQENGYGVNDEQIQEALSLNAVGVNNIFENYTEVDKIFATGYAQFKIIDQENHQFSYRLNGGWERTEARDVQWNPAFDLGTFYNYDIARLNDNTRSYSNALIENLLNYSGTFGKHQVDVLAGYTFQEYSFNERIAGNQEYLEPYYPTLANGQVPSVGSNLSNTIWESYLGRINYNYDERYLVTLTGRYDGSSRFAPANRYGFFPSASLGWRISNESFYTLNKDIFTDVKLRVSYGLLGNAQIGDYLYMTTVNRNIVYNFNGVRVLGGSQLNFVDENIKWENLRTSNIGLDLQLFQGKIYSTIEYFERISDDVLVAVPIPASTGSINSNPVVNAAKISNKGWEFMAGIRGGKNRFTYDISANYSYIKNEVLGLGINEDPIYGAGSITEVGYSVGHHYGHVYDGIFQSQEEIDNHADQGGNTAPGDIRFRDLNNDGVINADDRTHLGNAVPKHLFGLNLSGTYRNFDLTIFLSGMGGYEINSGMYRALMHTAGYSNWHTDIYDRWTPENTDTDVPRVVHNDPNENARDSNRPGWLQNGTHLRINTVQLGYNFPNKMINKVFQSARVYVSAQNLYTFTAYKGYNPDFNTPDVFSGGFDFGSYPRPSVYMIGAQLTF